MAHNPIPTPVLLVDDDEDDYLIIRGLLSKLPGHPFELSWTPSFEAAREQITSAVHAIYLIDYRLGQHTGLELLAPLNLSERPEPFIILTGAGDEKIERDAMRIGAADYLVKGSFDTELLSRVLRYSLQRKQMETQRIHQLLEVSKAKDEFIALASHQLRTPATAVKQYVGMLLEGFAEPLETQQLDFLNNAYDSNERQLQIIDDILRVAQVDLNKVTLQKQPVDIGTLVGSILDDQHQNFANRHQKVIYSIPDEEISVTLDAGRFRMALGNIVENANRYTPAGKTVTAAIRTTGKEVAISIRDEGVGIDTADFEKLFEKFSRIDNPLSTQAEGTGLGLYWTKRIIDLHGGYISVDSKIDQGTTFTITLPLK